MTALQTLDAANEKLKLAGEKCAELNGYDHPSKRHGWTPEQHAALAAVQLAAQERKAAYIAWEAATA